MSGNPFSCVDGSSVVVFFDGSNFSATCRKLDISPDFVKIRNLFNNTKCQVGLFYYSAIYNDSENSHNPVIPMLDYLSYNGYVVVSKPASEYQNKIKGNVDVEIAVDMLLRAPHCDHIVLFSGDGDFSYAVASVQSIYNVRVSLCSSIASGVGMCSNKLRQQVNDFVDLKDLKEKIMRVR